MTNDQYIAELKAGVISAAIQWWDSLCPTGWIRAKHLKAPCLGITSRWEEGELAEAVAALLIATRETGHDHEWVIGGHGGVADAVWRQCATCGELERGAYDAKWNIVWGASA